MQQKPIQQEDNQNFISPSKGVPSSYQMSPHKKQFSGLVQSSISHKSQSSDQDQNQFNQLARDLKINNSRQKFKAIRQKQNKKNENSGKQKFIHEKDVEILKEIQKKYNSISLQIKLDTSLGRQLLQKYKIKEQLKSTNQKIQLERKIKKYSEMQKMNIMRSESNTLIKDNDNQSQKEQKILKRLKAISQKIDLIQTRARISLFNDQSDLTTELNEAKNQVGQEIKQRSKSGQKMKERSKSRLKSKQKRQSTQKYMFLKMKKVKQNSYQPNLLIEYDDIQSSLKQFKQYQTKIQYNKSIRSQTKSVQKVNFVEKSHLALKSQQIHKTKQNVKTEEQIDHQQRQQKKQTGFFSHLSKLKNFSLNIFSRKSMHQPSKNKQLTEQEKQKEHWLKSLMQNKRQEKQTKKQIQKQKQIKIKKQEQNKQKEIIDQKKYGTIKSKILQRGLKMLSIIIDQQSQSESLNKKQQKKEEKENKKQQNKKNTKRDLSTINREIKKELNRKVKKNTFQYIWHKLILQEWVQLLRSDKFRKSKNKYLNKQGTNNLLLKDHRPQFINYQLLFNYHKQLYELGLINDHQYIWQKDKTIMINPLNCQLLYLLNYSHIQNQYPDKNEVKKQNIQQKKQQIKQKLIAKDQQLSQEQKNRIYQNLKSSFKLFNKSHSQKVSNYQNQNYTNTFNTNNPQNNINQYINPNNENSQSFSHQVPVQSGFNKTHSVYIKNPKNKSKQKDEQIQRRDKNLGLMGKESPKKSIIKESRYTNRQNKSMLIPNIQISMVGNSKQNKNKQMRKTSRQLKNKNKQMKSPNNKKQIFNLTKSIMYTNKTILNRNRQQEIKKQKQMQFQRIIKKYMDRMLPYQNQKGEVDIFKEVRGIKNNPQCNHLKQKNHLNQYQLNKNQYNQHNNRNNTHIRQFNIEEDILKQSKIKRQRQMLQDKEKIQQQERHRKYIQQKQSDLIQYISGLNIFAKNDQSDNSQEDQRQARQRILQFRKQKKKQVSPNRSINMNNINLNSPDNMNDKSPNSNNKYFSPGLSSIKYQKQSNGSPLSILQSHTNKSNNPFKESILMNKQSFSSINKFNNPASEFLKQTNNYNQTQSEKFMTLIKNNQLTQSKNPHIQLNNLPQSIVSNQPIQNASNQRNQNKFNSNQPKINFQRNKNFANQSNTQSISPNKPSLPLIKQAQSEDQQQSQKQIAPGANQQNPPSNQLNNQNQDQQRIPSFNINLNQKNSNQPEGQPSNNQQNLQNPRPQQIPQLSNGPFSKQLNPVSNPQSNLQSKPNNIFNNLNNQNNTNPLIANKKPQSQQKIETFINNKQQSNSSQYNNQNAPNQSSNHINQNQQGNNVFQNQKKGPQLDLFNQNRTNTVKFGQSPSIFSENTSNNQINQQASNNFNPNNLNNQQGFNNFPSFNPQQITEAFFPVSEGKNKTFANIQANPQNSLGPMQNGNFMSFNPNQMNQMNQQMGQNNTFVKNNSTFPGNNNPFNTLQGNLQSFGRNAFALNNQNQMNQQLPSNVPAQHMRIRQKKQDD